MHPLRAKYQGNRPGAGAVAVGDCLELLGVDQVEALAREQGADAVANGGETMQRDRYRSVAKECACKSL
jgi:hypothetical protein